MAEIVRHPPKLVPEEVMREWAKEGVAIDTKTWPAQNRRMSKDYELLPENSEAYIYIAMRRLKARRLARA